MISVKPILKNTTETLFPSKVRTGTYIAQELWGRSWFRGHGKMLLIGLHLMDTQSGSLKNPGPSTQCWPRPQWAEPSHINHYLRKGSKRFAYMFMQDLFFSVEAPSSMMTLVSNWYTTSQDSSAHHVCLMSKKTLVGYSHKLCVATVLARLEDKLGHLFPCLESPEHSQFPRSACWSWVSGERQNLEEDLCDALELGVERKWCLQRVDCCWTGIGLSGEDGEVEFCS